MVKKGRYAKKDKLIKKLAKSAKRITKKRKIKGK